MCGINGIVHKSVLADINIRIKKMNESIKHRGPDSEGIYIDNNHNIALGHRRLSIIDLEDRANQPMKSNSGKWLIVFNGEIYNYKKLREKTIYNYKTESDTEVILAYIDQFGIEKFLDDCNGMFAIGLYDLCENNLYLIRDRMGIKPLYYYIDDNSVIFSSEIKGILNSGLVKAEFNECAIDEYLGNRYIRAPYTFFNNIYQLKAGTFKRFDNNMNEYEKSYWDLPYEFNTEKSYNEQHILNEFESELKNAIEMRLISDVPLGTYLSGGVDSSLITAITALQTKEKVNTYTIGFKELNEFEFSNKVANKYNTQHHLITIDSKEYIDKMEEIIQYKDAPLGVPNEIPLAIMSKELKKNISVVLSGEGADELLGGYGRIFRSAFDYKNLDISKEYYDYLIDLYEYVPRHIRDKFLNVNKPYRAEFDSAIRKEFEGKENEENIFRFFHKYHIKGLLQRVDTTTMYASVEARVPFLDHKLIEYSYKNIPYDLKLKWKDNVNLSDISVSSKEYSEHIDTPKYLLKKLSERYLPKEVIYRKKMGFPVPLNNWIDELVIQADELLKDAYWIKKYKIDELVSECKKSSRSGQMLWMFINVEIFRKKYFNKEWRY